MAADFDNDWDLDSSTDHFANLAAPFSIWTDGMVMAVADLLEGVTNTGLNSKKRKKLGSTAMKLYCIFLKIIQRCFFRNGITWQIY